MNERDKEIADEAEAYADRDFKGEINWGEAYESKLIALIRADEREACAKVCDDLAESFEQVRDFGPCAGAEHCADAVRARGDV